MNAPTLALPIDDAGAPLRAQQAEATRLARSALWVLGLGVLPLAAWLTFAPLSSAVVAPAFVKVDLERRPVQHAEGGTVREVLVRDGQRVQEPAREQPAEQPDQQRRGERDRRGHHDAPPATTVLPAARSSPGRPSADTRDLVTERCG